MPSVGFEPAIPATKLVQIYASDLMATELRTVFHMHDLNNVENKTNMNIVVFLLFQLNAPISINVKIQ